MVRTHTCAELAEALADDSADHVIMAHVEGGWNCSAAELPPHTATVRRPLLLEGEGPGLLYYDVSISRLAEGCSGVFVSRPGGGVGSRWARACLLLACTVALATPP